METDGLSDLLQQAEQLTAEMDSGSDLPRVERNLTQIMEAGQRLWTRTAKQTVDDSSYVKASILLGSKGFDIPKMSRKLESLSASKTFEPVEALEDADIDSFLKSQHQKALSAILDETTKRDGEVRTQTTHSPLFTHNQHSGNEDDVNVKLSENARETTRKREWRNFSSVGVVKKTRSRILDPTDKPECLRKTSSSSLDWSSPAKARFTDSINMRSRSCMDNVGIAYARQIYIYNDQLIHQGLKKDLSEMCQQVAEKLDDKNISELWTMVRAMMQVPIAINGDITTSRSSQRLQTAFVNQARHYLEDSYKKYIQTTISGNLQQARLGGVPGTYSMVKSFLNVRLHNNMPGLEDGLVDGHPIWALIYYCVRCGDLKAALQVVQKAPQSLGDFTCYIQEYVTSDERRLSPNSLTEIHLQYRRSVRNGSDPFKRALYCIIGSCDPSDNHSEIAEKIDDYLWLKLCQLCLDTEISRLQGRDKQLSLNQLQKLLLEEYGESHFNAFQQPMVYFQVLFLTAQFEAAIAFLIQIDRMRCHAVHIALCLFELQLLALPNNIQAQLLTVDAQDSSPLRRLNFSLLLRMYTRRFETTDPREAIQYFYFLRDLKDAQGNDVFRKCVSELVLETREFDMLLGKLERNGTRRPGVIDKFNLDTMNIIQLVAKDSEADGKFEDAVKLYDLAKNSDKVMELLNKLLVPVLPQAPVAQSPRDRLRSLAVAIAERYQTCNIEGSRATTTTFYKLLDLMTFFDQHHSEQYDLAITTIGQLKLLPLTLDSVEAKVNDFKFYTDEIRRTLPDILLAMMNILFSQYKKTRGTHMHMSSPLSRFTVNKDDGGKESYIVHLRSQARALITFAGMLPYRMPGDTNSRLVQLEVLMN